uniref:ATP synthase complex subunit 8 n=1 Tax=Hydroporus planus TaxID=107871 RepID=A0A191ZQW4_9DYTI|nr:ATP synthase F0 subunit 8 [Hydroporus planus]ANJ70247.1 ATP synthase F0 subunit 8 [Hydroporus planus]QRV62702.1 ATP synthase F0 subunit 8 [Hydroporus planus]
MPQMAPMNWLILYIFFSMTFIMFNFLNYYLFLINKKNNNINKLLKKSFNWKW